MLQGYVIDGAAVGVSNCDCSVITLGERQVVIGLRGSACHQACPALHRVAIGRQFNDVEAGILSNIVQIDGIGPTGAAVD